jgi:hypothetical protein
MFLNRILINFGIFFGLLVSSIIANQQEHVRGKQKLKWSPIPRVYGTPWPMPQIYNTLDIKNSINEKIFRFKYADQSVVCDIVSSAFTRYYKIIFEPEEYEIVPGFKMNKVRRAKPLKPESNRKIENYIENLEISIQQPCETFPKFESDESCIEKLIFI